MSERVERSGLKVDGQLAAFLEQRVLAPIGQDAAAFWQGFAALCDRLVPQNRALLAKRDALQAQIDAWHLARKGQPIDADAYRAFLTEIGYLVPEPEDFLIGTQNVDEEIATMAGPQLVVPVLNARFLLNAANARWGSLYDAFYGTDALDAPPARPGGDEARGAAVIAAGRQFLDGALPGWEAALTGGECPHPYATRDGGVMFKHNGLHIEVVIDRNHPVGKGDPLGIADIVLEAALTTIVDLEDSVAAVDAEDKLAAYANWLGVIRGDLADTFEKGGQTITRTLAEDRTWHAPSGSAFSLPGRSLLFVRNVGHLMTNPAILLADGSKSPKASWTRSSPRRSHARREGPWPLPQQPHRQHLHRQAQDARAGGSGLHQRPVRCGRRPARPAAPHRQGRRDGRGAPHQRQPCRLHRGGEGPHRVHQHRLPRPHRRRDPHLDAGRAMIRKGAMKASGWIAAYEKRNVCIGLACGLPARRRSARACGPRRT
jgi:malate synthase